jgi:LmbE family N-acetylglucosaminyl deacetylase
VFFHAHPDDEAIATGGTMAKMASQGHRVILVTATRGELGEMPDGILENGETVADRRVRELEDAGRSLGVARGAFLEYKDSGMAGEPSNDDPECFWQADLEEASRRLARILAEESADILTVYDEHGGYGHPDHIQVHRVGLRAAEMAGTASVFLATLNRDRVRDLMSNAEELGVQTPGDEADLDVDTFGEPAERITTAVDVTEFLDAKRQAMRAHASQITENSFFLSMPEDVFALVWGTEWFIKLGSSPSGEMSGSLLDEP